MTTLLTIALISAVTGLFISGFVFFYIVKNQDSFLRIK